MVPGQLMVAFEEDKCRNLNMPKDLPKRCGGPQDFSKDSLIKETGLFRTCLTGEGMREQGIRIHHVFVSPALRCIQPSWKEWVTSMLKLK